MKGALLSCGRTMQQPMDRAHALPRRRWGGQAQPKPQSDKGIWGLRLPVARVDSGGGPNLPPVQRRAATSARDSLWCPTPPLAGGVTSPPLIGSGRSAVVSGSIRAFFFACSVLYFCPPLCLPPILLVLLQHRFFLLHELTRRG